MIINEPKDIARYMYTDKYELKDICKILIKTRAFHNICRKSGTLKGKAISISNDITEVITKYYNDWLKSIDKEVVLIDNDYELVTVDKDNNYLVKAHKEYPMVTFKGKVIKAHNFNVQARNSQSRSQYIMHTIMLHKYSLEYMINIEYKISQYHKVNEMQFEDIWGKISDDIPDELVDEITSGYETEMTNVEYPYTFELLGQKLATIDEFGNVTVEDDYTTYWKVNPDLEDESEMSN